MKKGGIGGANTNATGLKFEHKTDLANSISSNLSKEYTLQYHKFKNPKDLIVKNSVRKVYDLIRLKDDKIIGIIANKAQFYNVLYDSYDIKNINHKRWEPDEAFFNFENNTVFIVEKKWQKSEGSVDEKILSFENKRRIYQKLFNQLSKEPKPSVEFSALFNSSWWNQDKYQDCYDLLRLDGIKIFFDKYEYWWFGL